MAIDASSGVSVVLELRLRPMRLGGRLLACTGKALFGNFEQRLQVVRESQALWLAVGFRTTFNFANSASICRALSRIPGVMCEQRDPLAPAKLSRSPQLYEQPILQAVCLSYARAGGAEFLALADADDFAPPALPYVLNAVRDYGRLGGVEVFFDADLTCPPYWCPHNESHWLERCGANSTKRKNHWKPVVIPNRTADLSVHRFWTAPPFIRKFVWRVCYHHRAAVPEGEDGVMSLSLSAAPFAGEASLPPNSRLLV